MSPVAQELDSMLAVLHARDPAAAEQLTTDVQELLKQRAALLRTRENWPESVLQFAGALAGIEFERPEQPPLDEPEPW